MALYRPCRRERLQSTAEGRRYIHQEICGADPGAEAGDERSVFAAVLFPVVPVAPPGNYDDLFIEAAEYDDGFAHIVHGFQPVSDNLLLEQSDGFHPTREIGIRLGWDDEQILIWYMRQLMEDASVGPKQRIDAPIGASGYRIDVREKPVPPAPPGPWQSLNGVSSKAPLAVVDPVTEQSDHTRGLHRQGAQLPGLSHPAGWRRNEELLASHVLCELGRQIDGAAR